MTIFSGLDLVKAYFQCPISEESSYKTTTLTNWGTWRYLWMTMGLKNSAQTFQRLMSHVLDGIYNCFVYFDDILCFSNNEGEHQELVRKLIEVSNAGLALLCHSKSAFFHALDFLGYRTVPTMLYGRVTFSEFQCPLSLVYR